MSPRREVSSCMNCSGSTGPCIGDERSRSANSHPCLVTFPLKIQNPPKTPSRPRRWCRDWRSSRESFRSGGLEKLIWVWEGEARRRKEEKRREEKRREEKRREERRGEEYSAERISPGPRLLGQVGADMNGIVGNHTKP